MLVFSPAPGARDFGALVVLGLALAVALSLSAGLALLGTGLSPQRWAPAVAAVGARAGRGVQRMRRVQAVARTRSVTVAAANRVTGGWRALRQLCVGFPRAALAAGLVVAAGGLDRGEPVERGIRDERLLPSGAAERADARDLQRDTRSAGEVSVLVQAPDVASPRVLRWMAAYQGRVARRHGYRPWRPCARSELCPALSLTSLFGGSRPRTHRQVRASCGRCRGLRRQRDRAGPERRQYGVHRAPGARRTTSRSSSTTCAPSSILPRG